MSEIWMPVVFAAVIVLGIVAGQVWRTLLAKGLPVAADLLGRRIAEGDETGPSGSAPERAREIDHRVDALEERVRFLEALLEDRSASGSNPRSRL
jgi:hypothetical protein